MEVNWLMTVCVALVAMLYSSVGHAGASGYIAVFSLLSMAPADIRPTALVLNILVASIGTWQFARAGRFSWPLFWPIALPAVPMAFLGGALDLPASVFEHLVGAVLLLSALRLLLRPPHEGEEVSLPSKPLALMAGGALGLLSGLTGTGGGIFLTPLLILAKWARAGTAAGVSAPFILLNSLAGLAGGATGAMRLPDFILPLLPAVLLGGLAGSHLGSQRLPHQTIKRLLAFVLLIAGGKLVLT